MIIWTPTCCANNYLSYYPRWILMKTRTAAWSIQNLSLPHHYCAMQVDNRPPWPSGTERFFLVYYQYSMSSWARTVRRIRKRSSSFHLKNLLFRSATISYFLSEILRLWHSNTIYMLHRLRLGKQISNNCTSLQPGDLHTPRFYK